MYKKSIEYMVNALTDSTLEIDNSPIDTSFKDIEIISIRDSYENFESAYLYISNNSPDEDMTVNRICYSRFILNSRSAFCIY